MKLKPIIKCRACQSEDLSPIISLGEQYISNFVESEEEQGKKIPLNLVLCENCKLLQLEHNAPPELMWNEQYWYRSGISSTIIDDLKDIVNKAQELKELKEGDIVIDIGCNDGCLLDMYSEWTTRVGFEPSKNVAKEAEEKGHYVINNFFNAKDFKKEYCGKAKIITAISMFYDLENPNKFLKDIVDCLDEEGIFIIQQNYLISMLEQNAFDNICHEHREYYSLTSLKYLLEKYGLEVFDVELNDINGGSLRTYIKFKDDGESIKTHIKFEENASLKGFEGAKERIKQIEEKELELDAIKPYQEFALRIEKIKKELMDFLKQEKEKGKKICIYGASTRGNVALQYFGLTSDLIDCIADKNPDKWGKKTIGSLIPIVSPEEMRKINPDYLLVNTWHFFDEIKKQENEFFEKGEKFIVALPNFKVI